MVKCHIDSCLKSARENIDSKCSEHAIYDTWLCPFDYSKEQYPQSLPLVEVYPQGFQGKRLKGILWKLVASQQNARAKALVGAACDANESLTGTQDDLKDIGRVQFGLPGQAS